MEPKYLGNLAALFNPPAVRRLGEPGGVQGLRAALKRSGVAGQLRRTASVAEVFEFLYELLFTRYRCEYIYKNEIAAKILIGRHSVRTSALLPELQVRDSKADLVLINGTSVAYEIKTELDSLDRLPEQLASYRQAFDRVIVVTHLNIAHRVAPCLPDGTGLLALTTERRLRVLSEAASNISQLDHGTMFSILRREEYLSIIERHYGYKPDVPNTMFYTTCRPLFSKLAPDVAHSEFIAALKRRVQSIVSADVVNATPRSLLVHALSGNLRAQQLRALSHNSLGA